MSHFKHHWTVLQFALFAVPGYTQVGGQAEDIYGYFGTTAGNIGGYVSSLGDVNGDGVEDFLYTIGRSQAGGVDVRSGADGSLLHALDGFADFDSFGSGAAGVGDNDGDGIDDFIISAPHASPGGVNRAGSAYVFSGATGAILHQFDGTADSEELGQSVACAGNIDGDGIPDFLIGNDGGEPSGPNGMGAAYVYSGATGALIHQFDGLYLDDGFGHSVSGIGDLDGDGFDDLIIGSWKNSPAGAPDAGAVFVFSGATGTLIRRIDGTEITGLLGRAVSSCEDLDGDGLPEIIAGAPQADEGGYSGSGTVYVYSGGTGGIIHHWTGEGNGEALGSSLAGGGDIDGDGTPDIVVGANGWNFRQGATYLFSGATGDPISHRFGTGGVGEFGYSVDSLADINGDGLADVIASAPLADPGGVSRAGVVNVYTFSPFLVTDTYSVSAAAGATIGLALDFPDVAAFEDYMVLMSVSGNGPFNHGVAIPLSGDSFLVRSSMGVYPFFSSSNLQGTLDTAGKASASIDFPGGFASGLIGHRFWLAAVSIPAGQLPDYSSISVPIEIKP